MVSETVSKIEELRVLRKVPKKVLAKGAGISPTYYSMIAKGECVPSVAIVEALAVELGARLVVGFV